MEALTKRERDVYTLMLDGLSNREMAASLKITEGTVKFHVTQIMIKMGFRSRAKLIVSYYKMVLGL